jgi:hypothetical protein
MKAIVRGVLAFALALPCLRNGDSCRGETFDGLAAWIPREANALVLIDVEQMLQAPLAKSQGWAKKLEAANVERPVFLPPEAKKLVLGAALEREANFREGWTLGMMELSEPVGVRAIARAESGYVEEVNGTAAAFIPSGAAFVNLSDRSLSVMQPADRQFISRWIGRSRNSSRTELSPYLQSSLRLVTDRAQMLLAIDLTDVLSQRDIDAKLAKAPWMTGKQGDAAAIGAVVAKLQGAALRVAVGKDCQGQLQIDFDADAAPLKDVAKPMVLDVLSNLGFRTNELAEWSFSVTGKSIHMNGTLSTNAQRRVFSVVELPAARAAADTAASAGATGSSSPAGESDIRDASLAYFKSTEVLVADLRKGLNDTKATSAWMERYAKKIDDLPVLNVDELLLDYGDKLAETLRIMAQSKRQAGIRAGVRATDGSGGSYFDGYYYGEDAYTRAAERSQAKKEEMAVASDTRVEGWRLIDNATADIRKTLTKKYKVEF